MQPGNTWIQRNFAINQGEVSERLMGLFSVIYSGYRAGCDHSYGCFQTKDLTNLLDEYWLSPSGELFRISLRHDPDGKKVPSKGRMEPFDLDGDILVTSMEGGCSHRQRWFFTGGRLQRVLLLEDIGAFMLDSRLAAC